MHIYRDLKADILSLWDRGRWNSFVWQWRETFPANVPQLVSTEQNAITKGKWESLYFEMM